MAKFKSFLGLGREPVDDGIILEPVEPQPVLTGEHEEFREQDISILADEDGSKEQKLHLQAAKEVQTAAQDSLKRLHVLRLGRCPSCGEHLRRHLFASICEACGWHTFEVPRSGSVRIHLKDGSQIEGDRCYFVKEGAVLMLKDDLVVAKVAANSYDHIEYVWGEAEVGQRHKQLADRLNLTCGWCNAKADPDADGFHLAHLAFGGTQERYIFCSDECFEAFRKMYPARVHRNCYERECSECDLCIKRYADGSEGMHMLAKDYLAAPKKIKKKTD